jgi:tetratricopeptide (TPR) repeat protein
MPSDLLTRARKLEGYAAQDPGNSTLLLDLAETYHRAGEHERALSVVERVESLADGPAQCAALKGRLLLALGRWDEASALFERALHDAPDSAALVFNLGYSIWASGAEPQRAVDLLRRATSIEPANADFHYHLALALEETESLNDAMEALEQALSLNARHDKALGMLGRLKLDAGQFEQALELAERCIAAHPGNPVGWHLKGQVALFKMDAAAASKSLRQALDLDPADADTRVSLAQASLMQGRARHARTLLDEAVARDASHDGALCMLGWACVADNDAAAAGTAFERARTLAPDNPDALAGLALVRLSDARHEEALALAQDALALEPDHAMATLIIAREREPQGRPAEGKGLVASVINSTPFGPLKSTFGQAIQSSAASPAVRQLHRRFARAARPASHQPTET